MATPESNRIYIYDNLSDGHGLVTDQKIEEGRCLIVINKAVLTFHKGDKLLLTQMFNKAIGLT